MEINSESERGTNDQFESASVYAGLDNERADIPELTIFEKSPTLTPEQSSELQQQWETFWRLRSEKVEQAADTTIPEGALIHQLSYSSETFKQILDSGVVSGELAFNDKSAVPEDSETHYCADFFVNNKPRSVDDYVTFANERVTVGSLKRGRAEQFSLPTERNSNIALVVNPNQPELDELLVKSGTGADKRSLEGWPIRFPNESENHRAVLVGIPANFISEIIIGSRLKDDAESISSIKQQIEQAKLSTKVVDIEGNLI